MTTAFDSERTWSFAMSAEDLWDRISQVQEYPSWWPWLRRFDPGSGLVDGAAWHCEVAPPLPYIVRFVVDVEDVDTARSVSASVSGDIRGHPRLTLEPSSNGDTCARLVSRLAPSHPLLRGFGRVARPMVEWGHDWVLDQGRQQFIDRAVDPTER